MAFHPHETPALLFLSLFSSVATLTAAGRPNLIFILVDESFMFHMTQHHLSRKGILAPQHVSLICADPNPAFAWFNPSIAHIQWDSRKLARRIVGWAKNVAQGKDDRRQSLIKAEFVEGGTIGPTPGTGR